MHFSVHIISVYLIIMVDSKMDGGFNSLGITTTDHLKFTKNLQPIGPNQGCMYPQTDTLDLKQHIQLNLPLMLVQAMRETNPYLTVTSPLYYLDVSYWATSRAIILVCLANRRPRKSDIDL